MAETAGEWGPIGGQEPTGVWGAPRKRIRVLMTCTSPRNTVGGMESVFRGLAMMLRERGHTVTEAYLEEAFEAIDERTWGLRLESPKTRWKVPTLGSVARIVTSVRALVPYLRRAHPDIVNVHFVTAQSFYWMLLRPIFGFRVVLSVHGSDLARPANALDRALVPKLLRAADAVTVVSDPLAARVVELTGGEGPVPVVIPNGVDLSFWSPAGREIADTDQPTVVAVGRLHPVKGHDVLIRAMDRVRREVPAARLRLIGEGPARAETEALVRELGLEACVELVGEQSADAVRDELRQAAVFALPSRSEGMPISLIEAMATGCPAVATRVGGVPGVLADGAGLLVPPEDPDALADALIHLLSSGAAREAYADRARSRAQVYAWSASADAYEATLEGSVSKDRSRRLLAFPR